MAKRSSSLCGFAIIAIFAATSWVGAQGSALKSDDVRLSSRFTIYHHLGNVELPSGFTGYVGANWTDAWAGGIDSTDGKLKIVWRAGLIEYVLEKRRSEVIWQDVEPTPNFTIEWFRLRNDKGDHLVGKIGWLEFNAFVSNADDEDLFKRIVRSFRKERCIECRRFPFKIRS